MDLRLFQLIDDVLRPSLLKSLVTMVLLVSDTWHLSKLLQEHSSPSLDVNLKDGSERFEALARITEGSIMGLVICLRGPGDDDMAQSMTLVRFQQYMLELVATSLANRGFIVSGTNRQNRLGNTMVCKHG